MVAENLNRESGNWIYKQYCPVFHFSLCSAAEDFFDIQSIPSLNKLQSVYFCTSKTYL